MNVAPELKENRTAAKPFKPPPSNAQLGAPSVTPFTSLTNADMRDDMDANTPLESLDDVPDPSSADMPFEPVVAASSEPEEHSTHLCHAQYLVVPLEMLLHEHRDLRPSMHDIAEAYNLLSARLRNEAHALQRQGMPYDALEALRVRSGDLARLLHVHVRLALNKELAPLLEHELGAPMPLDVGWSAEDDIRNAEDSILVCHGAMRVVSDIMAFWRLYQLFSVDDLSMLLMDLCDIVTAKKLYIVKARQTSTMAVWILYAQNLPWDILATRKDQMGDAIGRAIRGEVGLSVAVSDGCRAFHKLLKLHGAYFLHKLEPLVSTLLSYLRSSSPETRLYAAHALAGLALAKVSFGLDQPVACAAIRSFIDAEPSAPHTAALQDVLTTSCKQQGATHCGDGPIFAVLAALSLVCILGPALYEHRLTAQLALGVAAGASTHGRSSARRLGARLWRALAWAAARASAGTRERTREKLWRIVAQEMRFGAGAAQVAGLLMTGVVADVGRAVRVVERMLEHEDGDVRAEGAEVLWRMLGVGAKPESDAMGVDGLVDVSLLEGETLFTPYSKLTALASRLKPFDLGLVRALKDDETLSNWDKLGDCWSRAAQAGTADEQDILAAWQSLLLSQSHLTQGLSHLTASPSHANEIAPLIAGFVNVDKEQVSADEGKQIEDQTKQLAFIAALWAVVRNVYSAPWLSGVARTVLDAVFRAEYRLADEHVCAAFVRCAAALVAPGTVELLQYVFVTINADEALGRKIWAEVAARYGREEQTPGDEALTLRQDLPYLLSLPLSGWCMNDDECELWIRLLRCAAAKAGSASMDILAAVFDHLDGAEDICVEHMLSTPRLISAILDYVDLSSSKEVHEAPFKALDIVLKRMFPPTSDQKAICLDVLSRMASIIRVAVPEVIVPVLMALNGGLCRWLENMDEVMQDSEYNEYIIPIYAAALARLSLVPPSSDALRALSDFLSSVFYAPHPGDGPLHFEDFWRDTYHGHARFYPHIPEKLGNCLAALDQCKGGSLGQGLSQSTGLSQSQKLVRRTQLAEVGGGKLMEIQASPDRRSVEDPCFPDELASAFGLRSSPVGLPRTPRRSQQQAEDHATPFTPDQSRQCAVVERRVSSHARKRKVAPSASPSTPKRRRHDFASEVHDDTISQVKSESPGSALKKRLLNAAGLPRSSAEPSSPTKGGMLFDGVEVPTLAEVRRNTRGGPHAPSPSSSRDDYDAQERAFLHDEQENSHDIDDDDEVLPSDEEELAEVTRTRLTMPPPTQLGARPRLDDRTHTEPTLTSAAPHRTIPALRRAATDTGSSAKLAALQRARTAILESESQTPTEDLMEAQQIAIQIQAELNDRLLRQLARRRR
ncbi:hypothetical protein HDZ31DRAFT_36798 [Schizophyllum fasciatum]